MNLLSKIFTPFLNLTLILLLALPASTLLFANDESSSVSVSNKPILPLKEKFRIVVLAGQSNMAGRGAIAPEDRIPIPRVLMLDKEGKWQPAVEPLHYDKPSAGVGPGREFARLLAESDPSIVVGLVPAACGGTSIDDWNPGAYFSQTSSFPYDDLISRTQLALKDGTLEAILWRQGESDLDVRKLEVYGDKLVRLFQKIRLELKVSDAPILIGEICVPGREKELMLLKQEQMKAIDLLGTAGFVPVKDVHFNPDKIHFDRQSQIQQGKIFYEVFRDLRRL